MFSIRHLATLAIVFVSLDAHAGVISNGDFSSAIELDGFDVGAGTVTENPSGDFAVFQNNGLLSQEFRIPDRASVLSFDFAFSTEGTPATAGSFPDSFSATLTTSQVLQIFVVDAIAVTTDPAKFPVIITLDPSVTIPGFSGFSNGTDYSGRISVALPDEVLGERATIAFDLFDSDFLGPDAKASTAAIDNVTLAATTSVIPEPSSGWIWIGVIAWMSCRYRRLSDGTTSRVCR